MLEFATRDRFEIFILICMRFKYSKYTVISVLRLFKIRYTSKYVQKLLEENSDGDNLWGIITVLRIYGLIVEPRRINNLYEFNDADISKPFLTEYDNNILLVKEIYESDVVGCVNGTEKTYCKNDFFTNWNGTIISIRRGYVVGEPSFTNHKRSDLYRRLSQIAMILSLIIMFLYVMVFFNMPLYIRMCFLLSSAGALMSYHIELSHFSSKGLLNNLCSLFKRSSCDQINNGKYQYISALGWAYFCSLCIFIILPLDNYTFVSCIVAISSIEVLWSLALQLTKQTFCINCMAVQAIVIIMVLICTPHIVEVHVCDLFQQGFLFISVFTIILSVAILKVWPNIVNQYRFKIKNRMMDYFKKQYLASSISSEESIIEIFLNPFCAPCKEEFLASYNLLANQRYTKVIPIIIVSDSKGEKAGISIIDGKSIDTIFNRLKEWYSWGYLQPEKYEHSYKVSPKDRESLIDVLKGNLNMAHTYNVQYTPSIIYNGIMMPKGISLVDVLTQ